MALNPKLARPALAYANTPDMFGADAELCRQGDQRFSFQSSVANGLYLFWRQLCASATWQWRAYVLPFLKCDDAPDVALRNAERNRERTLCFPCGATSADSYHVTFLQFRRALSFTYRHSSFTGGVTHVLLMGAEKHVVRANTSWIVSARAIVANLTAIWNLAVRQFPRKAMSTNDRAFLAAEIESTISIGAYGCCPDPARVGPVDFRPEAINYRHPQDYTPWL